MSQYTECHYAESRYTDGTLQQKNRSVDAIKIYGVKLQTFYVKLMRFVIENITTRELKTV
jgi:hypothetical protein